tara:strand:- start:14186 stop:14716 length:531 start_codon:yes stop_codon:yes gene_type:complete
MAFSPLPFEAIQSNASTDRASSINRGNEGMEQFFQDMTMNAKLSRDKSERGLESATYIAKVGKDARQGEILKDSILGAASLGFNAYATSKGWPTSSNTSTTATVASSSINNPNSYQSFKSDLGSLGGNLWSGAQNAWTNTGNFYNNTMDHFSNYSGHPLSGYYNTSSAYSGIGGKW